MDNHSSSNLNDDMSNLHLTTYPFFTNNNSPLLRNRNDHLASEFAMKEEAPLTGVEEGLNGTQDGVCKDGKGSARFLQYVDIKFTDVKYKVLVDKGSRWRGKSTIKSQILNGINGYVSSGEILAIMGPSGSGKTTFLNLLGGRVNNLQDVQGSILYNGFPFRKSLKRRMGFVTQDDVLFPHLTVRETLVFSALLRLPKELTKKEKVERAGIVIAQLGLQNCSNTMIGNQFLRGVSGGERKRVCIGQELLIDPLILFLDEPTSGLDSTTALKLVTLLQIIAHEGRIIVSTIHQPSSKTFHLFDKLLLLSSGYSIYFGEARGAMDYFGSFGFTPFIPMNPADFLLDLCNGNVSDMSLPPDFKSQALSDLSNDRLQPKSIFEAPLTLANDVKKYLLEVTSTQRSAQAKMQGSEASDERQMEEGEGELQQGGGGGGTWKGEAGKRSSRQQQVEKPTWGSTWWEQFMVLMVRSLKERRHRYFNWLNIFHVIAGALLTGCLWWQSSNSTPQQLQDQVSLIFYILIFWGTVPLFSTIFTFPLERGVLAKERATNMYRLSAYFLARTLGFLPLDLLLLFAYMVILYYMTNLKNTAAAFTFTLFATFLTNLTTQAFGLFIGAITMDIEKARLVANVSLLTFTLLGGYFVRHIPPFLAWIKYLSIQAHAYNILVQIQYGDDKSYDCKSGGGCKNIATSSALENTPLHSAATSSLALIAMVLGYNFLAYISLRRMKTFA